jgi:hypothetical protein
VDAGLVLGKMAGRQPALLQQRPLISYGITAKSTDD